MADIYEASFVKNLFDKMSGSYARMNYITSFGFSVKWRRQCVKALDIKPGCTVVDLMTGMGECWRHILTKEHKVEKLIALDFCAEMTKYAEKKRSKYPNASIEILNENVFDNSIPDNSVDHIVSGFGLKTFNQQQLYQLAEEMNRILKPNGTFSFIEVSVPPNSILRFFYMFYLKRVVPVLGALFLGNPETYKMLGVYTQKYANSKNAFEAFNNQRFKAEYVDYFYGCATGIKGKKTTDYYEQTDHSIIGRKISASSMDELMQSMRSLGNVVSPGCNLLTEEWHYIATMAKYGLLDLTFQRIDQDDYVKIFAQTTEPKGMRAWTKMKKSSHGFDQDQYGKQFKHYMENHQELFPLEIEIIDCCKTNDEYVWTEKHLYI